ncbi:MAG: hypothetical protein HC830_03360 [Bacteroidetes bacterium]|nr:hypothetical protein [Bacteroidota bacterium]
MQPTIKTLEAYYNEMWDSAVSRFEKGEFATDPDIDAPYDNRRGIILVAHPPKQIRDKVMQMLLDFQQENPGQYYYPETDLHITIFSVVTCFAGFNPDSDLKKAYISSIKEVLKNSSPFKIHFRGITAAPGCVIIRGFPVDKGLEAIRNSLYHHLKQQEYSINPITDIKFKRHTPR